jgi:hypothetical protein
VWLRCGFLSGILGIHILTHQPLYSSHLALPTTHSQPHTTHHTLHAIHFTLIHTQRPTIHYPLNSTKIAPAQPGRLHHTPRRRQPGPFQASSHENGHARRRHLPEANRQKSKVWRARVSVCVCASILLTHCATLHFTELHYITTAPHHNCTTPQGQQAQAKVRSWAPQTADGRRQQTEGQECPGQQDH